MKVQATFLADDTYAIGAARDVVFQLGTQGQTVEFAQFNMRNYGPSKELTPTSIFLNNIGGNYGTQNTVAVTGQPFM